jgi:hypothetical protein
MSRTGDFISPGQNKLQRYFRAHIGVKRIFDKFC